MKRVHVRTVACAGRVGRSRRRGGVLIVLTAALVAALAHGRAQATACTGFCPYSSAVALVPNNGGRTNHGGYLPTTNFPNGYQPTFFNVQPSAIGSSDDLTAYDTVVLVGICDIANFLGDSSFRDTINAFVARGGKLIIWDSECQGTSYANFLLPFVTNNPGALGAPGALGISEENSLSRSNTIASRYINTALVGPTAEVGDANVMVTSDDRWCTDMKAVNATAQPPAPRPTHVYAGNETLKSSGLGDGLIIYNGLDKDVLYQGQGFGTNDGRQNLGRIWLFELLQPFNPDGLPCGISPPCGNGTIDTDIGEQCDTARNPSGCPLVGGDPASTVCAENECVCVTPPNCGDGVITQGDEVCDPSAVPTGCGGGTPRCDTSDCNRCLAGCTCPSTPQACRLPFVGGKGSIGLKSHLSAKRNTLLWKWIAGSATTSLEFGSPQGTTSYDLCIYSGSTLVSCATAPAAGSCKGKPCWATTRAGFKYKDRDLTPDGLKQVELKSGADGKARIIVKGKGADLVMPDLSLLSSPVRVQLRNTSSGLCWGAVYSFPPATANDAKRFKDTAD